MKIELKDRIFLAKDFVSDIKIPAMPESIIKLEKLYSHRLIHRSDVIDIIKHDSVIAGELLKVANSKYCKKEYGEVDNIDDAVKVIGVENSNFIEIIKTASFKSLLTSSVHRKDVKEIFEYCVDIAFLIGEISPLIGENIHQYYTLGLFLDASYLIMIGKDKEFINLYQKGLSNPDKALKEELKLGADHAAVGLLIAKNWQLPNWMSLVILFHHEKLEKLEKTKISSDGKTRDKVLDAIASIKIAYYIASEVSFGNYISKDLKIEKDYAMWHLGLSNTNINDIKDTFIVDSVNL